MSEWISVNERYPKYGAEVLGFRDGIGVSIMWLNEVTMEFHDDEAGYMLGVTHWMPLPEFPAE